MTVSFEVKENTILVKGELDRFKLGEQTCYNFPAVKGDVTLDLSGVSSTDTAGLAWLLKLIGHFQKTQKVEITNEPDQLIALASISNVLELLPLKNLPRS